MALDVMDRSYDVTVLKSQVRLYSARGARTKPIAYLTYHTKEVAAVRFVPMTQQAAQATNSGPSMQQPYPVQQEGLGPKEQEEGDREQEGQVPCWWCRCAGDTGGSVGCGGCGGPGCWASGLLASASRDATVALWRVYPPKART